MDTPLPRFAGPSVAALLLHLDAGRRSLAAVAEQGVEMGRPGRIAVTARRDATGAIRASVGGGVVAVARDVIKAGP